MLQDAQEINKLRKTERLTFLLYNFDISFVSTKSVWHSVKIGSNFTNIFFLTSYCPYPVPPALQQCCFSFDSWSKMTPGLNTPTALYRLSNFPVSPAVMFPRIVEFLFLRLFNFLLSPFPLLIFMEGVFSVFWMFPSLGFVLKKYSEIC